MGNPSATLEQLVAESGWLHRLALALVKDEATADDLVQDTYSIAATQAPTDGRPIRPWLARVLWNRVRMASRSAHRRRAREQAFGELAAAPARPDEIVDRVEVQRMLAGFVLELPDAQRDVVLLHYFEGLTSSQIGLRLGISAGTVRWRLKQAIDELRERLEQRSKNRAWVPSLVAFARSAPSAKAALLPKLLVAAFVLLAILGFVLRAQLGEAQQVTPDRAAMHRPSRPSEAPRLDDTSAPGLATTPFGFEQVFGAEQRRIKGVVIDSGGRGVEGADIDVDCGYGGDEVTPKQRSGAGGAFALEVDPNCRYTVRASKDGARGEQAWSGPVSILVRRAGLPVDEEGLASPLDLARLGERGVTVQLRPMSLALIRVVDAETGAPIANAKVSSDGRSAVTGTDGVARIDVLLPAAVTVVADGYGHARDVLDNPTPRLHDRTAIILGEGPQNYVAAHVSLDIRLKRGIAVSGTVVGADGKPAAGANVAISGPVGAAKLVDTAATTDASGRFAAIVPSPGRYALSADRADLTNAGPAAVDIPAEGRTNLVARVVPRGEIHGTVVDASANPVAGARVSAADGSLRPAVTDAKGHFVIERVVGAVDIIAHRGSEASAFHHVEVRSGERAEVALQVGATGISGIAVDHDGAPVAGAQVWLNHCCEASPMLIRGRRYTTDATGRFSFDTPRGDFVLSVRRYPDDDYEAEDDVKVSGGSHDVRLVVP